MDGPDDLTDAEQEAVEAQLFRLADDEYVLAERYTEWQIYAPTIESDLALANVAQDEFGHARLWYDLLQEFGYSEEEVLWRRDPGDFQHGTLVELAFDDDGWDDVVVRSYLYDTAERLRLEALADSNYRPIADRIDKVLGEEDYHREHAESWLERLAETDAHDRLQDSVERLFPHALGLFASGPREDAIREHGVRSESLAALRGEWLDTVVPGLESRGLVVPDPEDTDLPDARGRDGSHTDDWFDLHEEFTRTHRELDFDRPTRLRGEEA